MSEQRGTSALCGQPSPRKKEKIPELSKPIVPKLVTRKITLILPDKRQREKSILLENKSGGEGKCFFDSNYNPEDKLSNPI